jgi:hypothetical protein
LSLQSKNQAADSSSTLSVTTIWIIFSSWLTFGELALSSIGQLNRSGNAFVLFVGMTVALFSYLRTRGNLGLLKDIRWRRFKKPFPFLYLICAAGALIGGAIHPPTNFDAFSYRIPRILHWLSTERWHWIGGADPRMDFSATGFEALMLPIFATFQTLRFAFLINFISYLLLPGLIFSVFSALGVKRSIAATWMWILPCASCFVMEAGSIGNDFTAVIYVLAALLFASRAIKHGRPVDVTLAIFSAALMTGAKASNLPLLLPIAICMGVVLYKYPRLLLTASLAGSIAALVSFAPIAIANNHYADDWTGDPGSLLKLKNPVVGIAGNALLLTVANLAPAVLPPAESINGWFNGKTTQAPFKEIKEHFADFRLTIPQMASEEHSGLGLGIIMVLLLGFITSIKSIHLARISTLGGAVTIGFGVALLVYMMKLGNCGAPRIIAPYYIGLVALPLLLLRSSSVFNQTWFRWSALILIFPVIPALIMNPARPLLPMTRIVEKIKSMGFNNNTLNRMGIVYSVYAERSDAQHAVRRLLPATASSIGFAGTSDESEYSFWLPLGKRHVRDISPILGGQLPDSSGLDAIVTSDWGCNGRFKMTPEQLAEKLNWQIIGTTAVRTYASGGERLWSVLIPKK